MGLTVFFVFVSGLTADAAGEIITVNYPTSKAVIEFDLLAVSIKLPRDSADLIKASVNGTEKVSITASNEHAETYNYVCFSVSLALGINSIEITAVKKNKTVDSVVLSVFRRSDLISEYKDAPPGFQKEYFHMSDNSQCSACHILKPSEHDRKPVNIATFSSDSSNGGKNAAVPESTCYSCHNKITAYKFVHGPASVWSCLSCHEPQTAPEYSVKKPDTEVCFNCHTEQKEEWSAKKFIHGPVNTGKCAICHSPHASENPFNLFKPTWDLCVSCHVDNGTGRHVIAGYVYGDSHPTRGKPDPLRKGKELSCASCHNPHASDYPRLWALEARSAFVLCQKCHQK
jgi:predicted CXXCH cytochrome family protein